MQTAALFLLNIHGSFAVSRLPAAYSSSTFQQKRYHRDPALPEWPLLCWASPQPEVGGGPGSHRIKLLPQQPHLPQQRQRVQAHQNHDPELPTQQREPLRQAAATWGDPVEQVGYCRGNKNKVGDHHWQDEEEEEAAISLADTAVEEKAVVVVVLDAQVTQFTVFGEVGKKQLEAKERKLEWHQRRIINVQIYPEHDRTHWKIHK